MIFVVIFLYGIGMNCILRKQGQSISNIFIKAIFMGIFATAIYLVLFLFIGFCLSKDKKGKNEWLVVALENIILLTSLIYVLTMNTERNFITMVANITFSAIIIVEANYDGEELRENRNK